MEILTSFEEVKEVVGCVQNEQAVFFRMHKRHKNFGKEYCGFLNGEEKCGKIVWIARKDVQVCPIPDEGIPFLIVGCAVYECEHGPNHAPPRKSVIEISEDHNYTAARGKEKTVRRGKKVDCPAKIIVREVVKFPEYRIRKHIDSGYVKKQKMSSLKCALLTTPERVVWDRRFYLARPQPEDHLYHAVANKQLLPDAENDEPCAEMSSMIEDEIENVVDQGATDPREIKLHLDEYIKDIFQGEKVPPGKGNRKYYPAMKTIRSRVFSHRARKKPAIDQGKLTAVVQKWKEENSNNVGVAFVSKTFGNEKPFTFL